MKHQTEDTQVDNQGPMSRHGWILVESYVILGHEPAAIIVG